MTDRGMPIRRIPGDFFTSVISDQSSDIEFSPENLSDRLLLIESSDLSVPWTEPRDLNASTMSFRLNDPRTSSPSSWHLKGVNAAQTDGSRRWIPIGTPPERLKTMSNDKRERRAAEKP